LEKGREKERNKGGKKINPEVTGHKMSLIKKITKTIPTVHNS